METTRGVIQALRGERAATYVRGNARARRLIWQAWRHEISNGAWIPIARALANKVRRDPDLRKKFQTKASCGKRPRA